MYVYVGYANVTWFRTWNDKDTIDLYYSPFYYV